MGLHFALLGSLLGTDLALFGALISLLWDFILGPHSGRLHVSFLSLFATLLSFLGILL